ncbi:uncharacterized protein si:dkey-28a3.2 [Amphiprion ocellaris]|uniref:uncharacterized protein si:dkey-28a3.2 n=1 Tax=Amphiprion ocellaris TaxID=80972 RepID=UPI002410F497|nr:uncharacterized protein si:dkey-28a3.2 [Amphiprion ocellaris]
MPIAKGKGGSVSHRYRPASEYDDATLAQKREYWRNKKREQRARLSERRGKPALHSRGEKLPHLNAPATVHSSLSSSLAALSSPLQSNDESYRPASQSANRVGDCSHEATENQKEKWFQTMSLNKVLPLLPVSCSISGKAAGGNTATVNRPTVKAAVRAVTSATSSGTQLNTSSSVPLVRVTRITNGSSTKITKIAPQPCVSMQGASVPKTQHKAQVALPIQPKRSATDVTTGMILVSSPCVPISIKTEGKTINTTPQSGIKSALVTLQRTKGAGNTQPSLESEEERAAKRREHWRIKKREQRAKLAARVAKARERAHGAEMTFQRLTAQKTGTAVSTGLLPPQSFLKGAGQKQTSRVKTSFASAKRDKDKLQSGAATVAVTNLQMDQIKVENTDVNKMTQTDITSDFTSAKTALASQRKLPSYGHLSNVTRGIARCKTPRQRFIDAQKNFMSQRNLRCKSPLVASMFGSRSMPKVDPNDTPEQIIAKRREYWRIKKREQRAKLSMEVKARLKEKDSLMRRVKRYQKILEDIRKARAMTGSTLTHASETIGGFIKEDGTLTVNILQSPTDHNTAEDKRDLHVASKNTLVTQPRHQPDTKQRSVAPVRINQPTPPLRPAQVKVSVPLTGQSVNKSPRLLSVRPRTQLESTTVPNSDKLATQTVGQLKLTHPQTPQNAVSGGSTSGSNLGGCVMKMAVSSSAPSLSALCADPELGEEEKMAKKREYWRIKKREQRAARAVQLKQGAFQARASPVLQRKKAQKQVAVTSIPLNRSLTNYMGNVQPLTNNSEPVMPHANEIKQESESMPAVDLNSQPEQAICPDIKPPASPPPRPAPQLEPDPALSADSQAATLLAVASMKKLLEESLSTVTDCNREQTDIKMETTEDASEQDMKPNLPQLFFQKDDIAPIAANLTLQIKSWQPDSGGLGQADSPSPQLKSSSEIIETPPPLSASTEVVLQPTCEHSSQTALNFIVNPSVETSDGPPSPRRTQRRTKKVGHQNCCSPEAPKLHHATATSVDQLQPQQQHCEQQIQAQEQCQNNSSPSVQRYRNVATEQCGLTSLQRKREYWKLMKRQQRARLRARQKERHGECSSRLSQRNIQAPGLVVFNAAKAKPALWPKPSVTSVAAVNSIPTVLVVSQTTCNADQTPDTLQVKLPVTSRAQNNVNAGLSRIMSNCAEAPESPQLSQEWTSRDTDVDSTPSLPTLKPPDNPLSSINLQPIEPLGQSPNPKIQSPRNFPDAQVQSPTHVMLSPTKLIPASTLVPPKQTPGESDEDFLRRKREYWRIKKKEQRARKAIRDKGIASQKASNNWTPILPAQELQTQDSGQWGNACEESELRMSTSVDTDPASFTYPDYSAPVEDESELLFADYEINNGEESPVSDTLWRSRYLMDYDPLNQLLVCMVCGELQYSHSLDGVRAHIDEAHPHTLNLEPEEKQGILDAWDEQVSQRERFFTSQLQQHSGALAEAHRD